MLSIVEKVSFRKSFKSLNKVVCQIIYEAKARNFLNLIHILITTNREKEQY